jgi:formate/nitrite transporter FocA (FNT family)
MLHQYFSELPYPGEQIELSDVLNNLLPVVLGNILGGSVFVALVYYVIYRRPAHKTSND